MSPDAPVLVAGCGPAGLMAATVLVRAGLRVEVFDAMASPARKFVVAGKGGLNLTHSEEIEAFVGRYGDTAPLFRELLAGFSPDDLRRWLSELGVETWVGSSGRVFPQAVGAQEILKRWLAFLGASGASFHFGHRWQGFGSDGAPIFCRGDGSTCSLRSSAFLLALGGASWPQTGSDGSWVSILQGKGVEISPLEPANCGLEIAWSEHLRSRFAGTPLKNLLLRCEGGHSSGDVVITTHGLEGGGVYPLSSQIRRALKKGSPVSLFCDIKRDLTEKQLAERLAAREPKESLATFLKKSLRLAAPAYSLLRECCSQETFSSPELLAAAIKNLPLPVIGLRPIAEAISSAGGVMLDEVDEYLMLKKIPGVFVAGEMLDWEAPTGGYLLQGAFSTGYRAGLGIIRRLSSSSF